MKILYVTNANCEVNSGVKKKIFGQIKAMKNRGFETSLISTGGKKISTTKDGDIKDVGKVVYNNFLLVSPVLYRKAYEYVEKNDIDVVYIRYSISDYFLINFLKKLKKKGVKIVVEIASYPYDKEYESKPLIKRGLLYLDKAFRKNLKKYVDFICTPSHLGYDIYDIKTVEFENGVNVEDIKKREYVEDDTFRILGLAKLNAWHGYDRVIRGIADYYADGGKREILFNVVGGGGIKEEWEELAKDLGVEKYVNFTGWMFGKDLDDIFNRSDIGIGAIAMCRLASRDVTSLKAREFAARGLPFVDLKADKMFSHDFPYVYHAEDLENALSIKSVLDWFDGLEKDKYLYEMRKFAEDNLTWDKNFGTVLEEIEQFEIS